MGVTILTPIEYQDSFIKGCFDAVINFREPEYNFHQRTPDLETAKQLLESASTRLAGVTFETRPDYCKEIHMDRILSMGGTRVEIGLQTTRDDVRNMSAVGIPFNKVSKRCELQRMLG